MVSSSAHALSRAQLFAKPSFRLGAMSRAICKASRAMQMASLALLIETQARFDLQPNSLYSVICGG